jgi:hypothetical protein
MAAPAEDAYWFVAGDTTQVWSSARVAYVPTTDTAYLAWLAAGNTTIEVISEDELSKTLNDIGLGHLAPIVSAAAVDRERDRRNNQGQFLTLKTGKVLAIATATREDFDNINYSADAALSLIARTEPGIADTPVGLFYASFAPRAPTPGLMTFRDFYRQPQQVTYHEMAEIQVWVTDNIVQVNKASHALKDMDPIPRDYTDDKYWPLIPLPPAEPPP